MGVSQKVPGQVTTIEPLFDVRFRVRSRAPIHVNAFGPRKSPRQPNSKEQHEFARSPKKRSKELILDRLSPTL